MRSGLTDNDDYEVDARSSPSCCYVVSLSVWDLYRAIDSRLPEEVPEISDN